MLQKAINYGAIQGHFRTPSFRIDRATDLVVGHFSRRHPEVRSSEVNSLYKLHPHSPNSQHWGQGQNEQPHLVISLAKSKYCMFFSWIFWSSIPYWAGQMARIQAGEPCNLNLPSTVLWKAKCTIQWHQLDPEILQLIQKQPPCVQAQTTW